MSSDLIRMNVFDNMNIYGSIKHNDDNSDVLQLPDKSDSQGLLDYMVSVICRRLQTPKAFKGGYLLNQLLKEQSRMTHDIDFSISDEAGYEQVKQILQEIAEVFLKNDIIADYKIKPTITQTSSGGVDFYDSLGAKMLGVDVGLHSLAWGITSYNFEFVTTDGFSIERILSDKLMAILSRKRFRRTKDLYDFWVITNNFDFDYQKLCDFVGRRGGAEWDNIPFNDTVLIQYEKAWSKLILQTPTHGVLEKPPFNVVLERFYYVALAMKSKECHQSWSHDSLVFKE